MQKILLPENQAPSESEELKHRLAHGDPAARPVSSLFRRDEDLVSEVENLLGVPPDVLEGIEPISPELAHSVVAVENRLDVGGRQVGAGPIFASGVPARKNQFEVPSVSCCVCVPYSPRDQNPPKPRSRPQPREGVSEQAINAGKADGQALIQGPAQTCSFTERVKRDSDRAHHLDVLMRHCPSISRQARHQRTRAQPPKAGYRDPSPCGDEEREILGRPG